MHNYSQTSSRADPQVWSSQNNHSCSLWLGFSKTASGIDIIWLPSGQLFAPPSLSANHGERSTNGPLLKCHNDLCWMSRLASVKIVMHHSKHIQFISCNVWRKRVLSKTFPLWENFIAFERESCKNPLALYVMFEIACDDVCARASYARVSQRNHRELPHLQSVVVISNGNELQNNAT
jgi:uncharacterized protein Usg